MIAYLVNQIVLGNLTYIEVTTKRPDLKDRIDVYITDKQLNIDKTV